MSTRLVLVFITSAVVRHQLDCNAWIVDDNLVVNNALVALTKLHQSSFGFEEGGRLTWNLTCKCSPACDGTQPRVSIRVLLCPRDKTNKVDKAGAVQLCVSDSSQCSSLSGNLQHRYGRYLSWVVSSSIGNKGFYTSYFLNCGAYNGTGVNLHCKSHLVLLNPGGEHLSYDEIPLPAMYVVGVTIWSGILVMWLINWAAFWKYSNPLHRVLFVVPLIKAALHLILYFVWESKSRTGYDNDSLLTVQYLVRSVQEGVLFFMLMLLADGWYVTCTSTSVFRWLGTATLFAGLATSLLCVEMVHEYFLAFTICCCLFMLYKALKWATRNIDHLIKQQTQISSNMSRLGLSYVSQCTLDHLLTAKEHLFRYYRAFIVVWAILSIIAIAAVFFVTEEVWIRALVVEAPEVVVILGILLLFRLRNFAKYRNIKLKAPESSYTIIYSPTNEEGCCHTVYLADDADTLSIGTKQSSRSSESRNSTYIVETSV